MDPGDEVRLDIIRALADADSPLRKAEIASLAGRSKQLVAHHLPALVSSGLVLPVKTLLAETYRIQPVLVEFDLSDKVFRRMFAEIVGQADLSHAKDKDDATLAIVHMLLLMRSGEFDR